MVMTGAMVFRSPIMIPAHEMINVRIMARRGSFAGPLPLPKKFMGLIILSLPKACSIRGAPIMEPSADDSVAAKTPAKISAPLQAVSFMTK